jgi:protein TonB
MSRLEKKCFLGATGFHLLLLMILIVGPAFLRADKVDDSQVIEFIPMTLTDEKVSNPGASAPRPPAPQPQPQPRSQPEVQPPAPQPQPQPVRQPDPPKVAPAKDPKPPAKPTNSSTATAPPPNIYANAAKNLRQQFTPTTKIEMPEGPGGGSGPSYANYAQEVRRVYTDAWRIPPDVNDDEATVKVRVTIARGGNVISASIIQSSGSPLVDGSIQATLDRVTFVAPFPEGAKDSQRTFTISFSLKAKKLLG